MERLAYEIKRIDNTIQEVNERKNTSFRPALPEAIYNLDQISKGSDENALRVLCLGEPLLLSNLYEYADMFNRQRRSARACLSSSPQSCDGKVQP